MFAWQTLYLLSQLLPLFFYYFCFEIGPRHVAQGTLEMANPLPQHCEVWAYKPVTLTPIA